MPDHVTPAQLQTLLAGDATYALIDVREHGEYNTAHIPGACSVPRRQLEFRMHRLVPYTGTRVILYDDDERRAVLASETLNHLGYPTVEVLAGGINRWASEGGKTEWGMNVPSKDFGEKMQVVHDIPEMHPLELHQRMARGENIVLLDSRTAEEHRRATIPGSRSAPGGELALRITDLAPDPEATVVVHCAGRTRSITGARVIQRMGGREVYDLQNGTMGWQMAGLELEHGSDRVELPAVSQAGLAEARRFAERIAGEDEVSLIDADELEALMGRAEQCNTYLIDVRTQAEYAAGHIPGFQWSPGGQAVQRTDDLVGVKNGHIVFTCDGQVRAIQTASWYRQMGFPHVYVLDGGCDGWRASGRALATQAPASEAAGYDVGLADERPMGYDAALAEVRRLSPEALKARLDAPNPPCILYVDTSRDFSRAHIPGTRWLSRSLLELEVASVIPSTDTPVIVTCRRGPSAVLAGATLQRLGYGDVSVLEHGVRAWQALGFDCNSGLNGVMKPPDDVVYMGSDRHWSAAIFYLQWEEELGHKYE